MITAYSLNWGMDLTQLSGYSKNIDISEVARYLNFCLSMSLEHSKTWPETRYWIRV